MAGGCRRGCSQRCRVAVLLCLQMGALFWHVLKWFLLLCRWII